MNDLMDGDVVVERAPRRQKVKQKKRVAKARVVHAEANVTRNSPRPPPRPEGTRDPARELARETTRRGAVVAVGHGGEKLTRRRTSVGDKFAVPQNEIPAGWDYQWNTVTVLNKETKDIERGDLMMHENGWRPVPASRHPGRWTPPGFEGSIIIEGLRLEERPLSLSKEAQQEDTARAKAQVRDRTDALRMTQRQLPGANVALQRNGAIGMGMKMSIDPALDIPRPEHQIDDGSAFDE
jgi:hypothetical protein